MFSRIKKFVLGFLAALLCASILLPRQVHAQDVPIPIFGQLNVSIQAAQMCTPGSVTIDLIPPAPTEEVNMFQIRDNLMWIPSVLNIKGDQCVPIPEEIADSVGPVSSEETLITFYEEGSDSVFQEIGGVSINTFDVPINPTLLEQTLENWAAGKFQGTYPQTIEGVWITEITDTSTAEQGVLIPPDPFGSADLAQKLFTASEGYGNATFLNIGPEMVLYLEPSESGSQRTVASFQGECPALDVNDFHAIYLYSFPKFTNIGPVSRMDMWSKISHTPKTFEICPQILTYTYLNGPDTWLALHPVVREEIERLIEHQSGHVRRNIVLQQPDGSLVPGLASIDVEYNGEVAWIGMAIAVGSAIIKIIAAARGVPVMP